MDEAELKSALAACFTAELTCPVIAVISADDSLNMPLQNTFYKFIHTVVEIYTRKFTG